MFFLSDGRTRRGRRSPEEPRCGYASMKGNDLVYEDDKCSDRKAKLCILQGRPTKRYANSVVNASGKC